MLLRMLNDPCQSETGRQMARANPQYRRCYAESQEPGAALAQSSQILDCLGRRSYSSTAARQGAMSRLSDLRHSRAGSTMGRTSSYLDSSSQRLSHDAIRPDRPGPSTLPARLDLASRINLD